MPLRLALLAALQLPLAGLAASASAQPAPVGAAPSAPDVVGTWDLESAEDVPLDDVLVFARLTFTGDEVRTLLVTVDGDGALSGERTRARYHVSDGQLIVRKLGSVTVWDVARDVSSSRPSGADRLAVHDLETGVVLRLRPVPPDAGLDSELVGTWSGIRDGRPFTLRLRPDGMAEVQTGGDHDASASRFTGRGEWTAAGAYLVLGEDPAHYGFQRDADGRRQLVVDAGGERTVLRRLSE